MRKLFVVEVPGDAKTKGSVRSFVARRKDGSIVTRNGKPVVVSKNDADGAESWEAKVAWFVRQEMTRQGVSMIPKGEPVVVSLWFWRRRPRSHFGTGRNADKIKPSAPLYPTSPPDIDKLTRAALDALTGVAWADDAQVVLVNAYKLYSSVASRLTVSVALAEAA